MEEQKGMPNTETVPPASARSYCDARRQKRRGDGNCFWRSVAGPRWKQAKRLVKDQAWRYMAQFTNEEKSQIAEALRAGAWVNEPTIKLAVCCLQLDLWICTERVASRRWSTAYHIKPLDGEIKQMVVVALAHKHYDRIVAKQLRSRRRPSEGSEEQSEEVEEPNGQPENSPPTPAVDHLKRKKNEDVLLEERQDGQKEREKPMGNKTPEWSQKRSPTPLTPPTHRCRWGWLMVGWMMLGKLNPSQALSTLRSAGDADQEMKCGLRTPEGDSEWWSQASWTTKAPWKAPCLARRSY